jgi:hypothetical protein
MPMQKNIIAYGMANAIRIWLGDTRIVHMKAQQKNWKKKVKHSLKSGAPISLRLKVSLSSSRSKYYKWRNMNRNRVKYLSVFLSYIFMDFLHLRLITWIFQVTVFWVVTQCIIPQWLTDSPENGALTGINRRIGLST